MLEGERHEPPGDKQAAMVIPGTRGLEEAVAFVSVQKYVEVMDSLVPEHLTKRIAHLIKCFIKANHPSSSPHSMRPRLVHGIIRHASNTADSVVMVGVLPNDPADEFEVLSSLAYRIQ